MTCRAFGPIEVVIDIELQDIIPHFFETRRKEIQSLETSLATGDLNSARKIGHNMKGTGGSYGFDEISRLGEIIEQAAGKGDSKTADDALRSLRDYLDRVVVSYEPEVS